MTLTLDLAPSNTYTLPRYVRIAEALIGRIEAGELSPGMQLPPERELSQELDVNRMTLRRALAILETQGLLLRRHGVGTFVAEPKIDRRMDAVFRFTQGMQLRGFTPGARLISVERGAVETALGRQLGLAAGDLVYRILRVRSINQEPVMIERYTIPARRFPNLDGYDLETRSVYEIIEIEYGISITRARQSFEPALATEFEADLLGIPVGAPLMLERRLSLDREGRPVEYGKDRYRGDRFRFVVETEEKPVPFNPTPFWDQG